MLVVMVGVVAYLQINVSKDYKTYLRASWPDPLEWSPLLGINNPYIVISIVYIYIYKQKKIPGT